MGQTGVWSARGPVGGNVYCVVADPTRPATLYSGTDQGVFKSDDGGANWRVASTGIPPNRVQTLAIDPTTPATLYAGTRTPDGAESVGIFKSTDAGASWTPINDGLVDPLAGFAPLDVEALSVNPRNPQTILAGTRFSEIFKSIDGGVTWKFKTFGGINVGMSLPDAWYQSAEKPVVRSDIASPVAASSGPTTRCSSGKSRPITRLH